MRVSLRRRALFALATSERFERVAPRELAWRRLGARYVAGPSRDDAIARARTLMAAGMRPSIDFFGERVTDDAEADAVVAEYAALAAELPEGAMLALDLSHLAFSAERLAAVVEASDVRVQVGAEEAEHTDRILDAILAVDRPDRLSATLQANLRRSPGDLERLAEAGVAVRIVKGAYVEPEALPYGEPTDLAYLSLAHRADELGMDFSLGTHHGLLREACPPAPVEMLLGVRPEEAERLGAIVYVPYGPNWFRYAMRRLAESQGA